MSEMICWPIMFQRIEGIRNLHDDLTERNRRVCELQCVPEPEPEPVDDELLELEADLWMERTPKQTCIIGDLLSAQQIATMPRHRDQVEVGLLKRAYAHIEIPGNNIRWVIAEGSVILHGSDGERYEAPLSSIRWDTPADEIEFYGICQNNEEFSLGWYTLGEIRNTRGLFDMEAQPGPMSTELRLGHLSDFLLHFFSPWKPEDFAEPS